MNIKTLTIRMLNYILDPDSKMSFPEEISNPKEEYKYIFKSIPILFEYLFVTLQTKPQVLETNNVKNFKDMSKFKPKRVGKRNVENKFDQDNQVSIKNVNDIFTRDPKSKVYSTGKGSNLKYKAEDFIPKSFIDRQVDKSSFKTKRNEPIGKNVAEGPNNTKLKKNAKRNILSQIVSYFGFGKNNYDDDDDGNNQEAADIFDHVEEESLYDAKEDQEEFNEIDDRIEGFEFSLKDVQDKILLTEKELEKHNTDTK